MKKKILALILGFGLLGGSTAALADGTYTVKRPVNYYYNSIFANFRVFDMGQYKPGEYYIYKESNNMINITKNPDLPGAWINPEDNFTESDEESDIYIAHVPLSRYVTAEDAKLERRSVGRYEPGEFHIFRELNGILNITKVPGQPGSWINPAENIAPGTDQEEAQDITKYHLMSAVPFYATADDAKNGEHKVGECDPGEYYKYRTKDNMLNLGRSPGQEGYWINPSDILKAGSRIMLYDDYNVYLNADDALHEKNPVKTYKKGMYFIYKYSGGMYNITKTKGQAGAWIDLLKTYEK